VPHLALEIEQKAGFTPGFRVVATCKLSDTAPIGTPCAEKIFASNIQRDSAT